jgi:hypothetical protein
MLRKGTGRVLCYKSFDVLSCFCSLDYGTSYGHMVVLQYYAGKTHFLASASEQNDELFFLTISLGLASQ